MSFVIENVPSSSSLHELFCIHILYILERSMMRFGQRIDACLLYEGNQPLEVAC
ncbi:MAG: hypothetical protein QXQ94_09145 [Candidatus Bathyarchaeia archaeon]